MNNKEDNIKDLIANYVAGEYSMEEEILIHEWINKSEENKRYYFETKIAWNRVIAGYNPYGIDTKTRWEKVNSRIGKKSDFNVRNFFKIAASIIILFSLGFSAHWILQKSNLLNKTIVYHEVIAPFGSRTQLYLSDGSKVWLNAGSALRYPSDYSPLSREVFLKGEAYFDIVTDKSNPFIVNVHHIKVKAYGTKFNVKAYPEEDLIETTLEEGRVSLKLDDKKGEVFLKENQKAYIPIKSNEIKIKEETKKPSPTKTKNATSRKNQILKELEKKPLLVEKNIVPELSTSWKEEEWIFKRTTMEEMSRLLERRYDVAISFRTRETGYLEFSGTIRDETLEMMLKAMSLIAPIKYEINGKEVEIYEDSLRKEEYLKYIEK